jgi:hypothetical protein
MQNSKQRFLQSITPHRITDFAFGQNAEGKTGKGLKITGLRKTGEIQRNFIYLWGYSMRFDRNDLA